MSTPVPPAAPAALTALAVAAGTTGSGTLVRMGAELPDLDAGLLIQATVQGRAGPGLSVLESSVGRLVMQSTVSPPIGSTLTLQVSTGGAAPQVQFGVLPAASAPAAASTPPSAMDLSVPGQALMARIVPPGGPASAPISGTAVPGTGPGAAPTQPLPVGTNVAIRILGIAPSGAPGAPAGSVISGTVGNPAPSGETLIQTPFGTLAAALRHPPPPGSILRLTVEGWTTPTQSHGSTLLSLSPQWQALAEALAALRSADPTAARALAQAIPQPGAGLSTSILFFLSALSTGDIRRWIGGEALRGLDRGSGLERIRGDFGEIGRIASEPGGQDWRLILLPLLTDHGLDQLRLFLREEPGKDGEDAGESGQRFVLDVAFSTLGRMQFDGLMRNDALRLILRSEAALPEAMRRDIREIYLGTLSALGKTGEIAFHVTRPFPVNPMPEHAGAGVEVTI